MYKTFASNLVQHNTIFFDFFLSFFFLHYATVQKHLVPRSVEVKWRWLDAGPLVKSLHSWTLNGSEREQKKIQSNTHQGQSFAKFPLDAPSIPDNTSIGRKRLRNEKRKRYVVVLDPVSSWITRFIHLVYPDKNHWHHGGCAPQHSPHASNSIPLGVSRNDRSQTALQWFTCVLQRSSKECQNLALYQNSKAVLLTRFQYGCLVGINSEIKMRLILIGQEISRTLDQTVAPGASFKDERSFARINLFFEL